MDEFYLSQPKRNAAKKRHFASFYALQYKLFAREYNIHFLLTRVIPVGVEARGQRPDAAVALPFTVCPQLIATLLAQQRYKSASLSKFQIRPVPLSGKPEVCFHLMLLRALFPSHFILLTDFFAYLAHVHFYRTSGPLRRVVECFVK